MRIKKNSFEEIAFSVLNSEYCVKGLKRLEPSDSDHIMFTTLSLCLFMRWTPSRPCTSGLTSSNVTLQHAMTFLRQNGAEEFVVSV